jgi:LPXTG-motif cell wall-anchored protein
MNHTLTKHAVGRRAVAGMVAAGIVAAPILIASPASAAPAKLPPNCVTKAELFGPGALTLSVTAFPAHHAILVKFSSNAGCFPPGAVLFFSIDGTIYKAVITKVGKGTISGTFTTPTGLKAGFHKVALSAPDGTSVASDIQVVPAGPTEVLGESFTKAPTTGADPAGTSTTAGATGSTLPTAVEAFSATKSTGSSSLPFTGAETGGMVLAGLVLVGGGGTFVAASRRRRAKGTS